MKTSSLFIFFAPAVRAVYTIITSTQSDVSTQPTSTQPTQPDVCRNNCLRRIGLSSGEPALETRLSDCSSFLAVTVTPDPSTVTSTSGTTTTTVTQTFTSTSTLMKRQAASAIPAYATYCVDASAYASACSYAGVTADTITAPAPTVTVFTPSATAVYYTTYCVVTDVLRSRGYHGAADFVNYMFH